MRQLILTHGLPETRMTRELVDAGTFRDQLDALAAQFAADFRRGDAEACARAYAVDAVRIEVRIPPSMGRSAITSAIALGMAKGIEIFRFETMRAAADGTTGYALMKVVTNLGDGFVMLGLERGPDGRWLVAAEAIVG
jgi:ketosteroid isomerase-like protein